MLPRESVARYFKRNVADLDKRESSVEERSGNYAVKLGYWHRKFKSPGRRSAPDRIFANAFGEVIFIEFKALGKPATELQLDEHATMRANGLIVYVCDNFNDAKKILDRHCL